ncbi:MAG: DUF418 domain-containing protein, partial [Bacteroidales bacterium]|nr:DUF418 domain-containing protein [Bacteroidales bacterium]
MSHHFNPTVPGQRIPIIDTLRGFAILGILMVNMLWMSAPVGISLTEYTLWDTPLDKTVEFFISFLFEGKFYVLFSMLFGYGFWLFLQKMNDGASPVKVYAWRLILLILFGVAHIVLLWPGDILFFYGVLGLLLLLFRNKSNRSLIKWALALLIIPIAILGVMALLFHWGLSNPHAAEAIESAMEEQTALFVALIEKALKIYPTGSFSEMVNIRLEEYTTLLSGAIIMFYPNVLAMFLVGFYAGKKQLLYEVDAHLPYFRKMAIWGLSTGLLAGLAYAYLKMASNLGTPTFEAVLAMSMNAFGGPMLSLGYVSAILLLIHHGRMKACAAWLAAVGRMALSNYLMHSIIAALIFQGYGLALYGQV